ncbi:hypothetical protein A2V82_15175 [candidate division KSB1 bacterium RBG_16_48_16]|nr:MAG: hypothetical protein A2V82_15175 [candidate division KSB1 bacterium RBG_16_48_16]
MCLTLVLSMMSGVFAQELVLGGNMEDPTAWTIYNMGSTDEPDFEFNYKLDTLAAGSGGCLNVYGGSASYTNLLFWQELTLVAGQTYKISGAFRDLSRELSNFWCQIYISTEAPVDGVDWTPLAGANSDMRLSFNTWNGCGPGVDGTFQDNSCEGSGPLYTTPGDSGQDVTVYYGLKIGVWTDSGEKEFDVLVDELSLVPLEGTAVGKNSEKTIVRFRLEQNFPNPFNPATVIPYTLKNKAFITIAIYNVLGEHVATLVDRELPAGEYKVQWDGHNQSGREANNGIYFYEMKADGVGQTRKMMLMR